MSEPTGDGNQKPDPDAQPETGKGQPENQEQTSGSVFNDPTAPLWADPTAPIPPSPAPDAPSASTQDSPALPPVPPSPPGPGYPAAGQQPAPPMSNPYAQQPPTDPYGQPAGQYGQPTWSPNPPDPYGQPTGQGQYGQPQYGGQYPAYGQSPYATGPSAPSNTSGIILTIVSGLATVTTCVIGIPSLVFGIMALTSNRADPAGSRRKARTGWIILAINAALVVIAVVAVVAIVLINSSTFDSNSGF